MKEKLNEEIMKATLMEKNKKRQEVVTVINSRITGVKNDLQ
jgi:hypothetical protein